MFTKKIPSKQVAAMPALKPAILKERREVKMNRKVSILILAIFLVLGLSSLGLAAKVPAPDKGGDGFTLITLEEAQQLRENGAVVIACHSHTTDFMKGHPAGTIHITCLVPKDHKRTDLPLTDIAFAVDQLPEDKETPIITYCASNT